MHAKKEKNCPFQGEKSSLGTAGSDDLERPTGRTGMAGDGFCRNPTLRGAAFGRARG